MIAWIAFALLNPSLAGPVNPSDARIAYVGRFTRDAAGPACQWPASEVRVRIRGRSLGVEMEEKGADRWQIVIDGKPAEVLAPTEGRGSYSIDAGTVGEHEIRLVKRTEAFVGTTRFLGFDPRDGTLEKAPARKRHLEVVGDSITCGYGDEGASQTERFKPETENAFLSYASIAASSLDADVEIVAWSGRKMWPDNTMPEIYDLILPTDKASVYDFKGPSPDAVVINLATNDFGVQNPDETQWTGAYEAFIRRLWSRYPKAKIYVAIGSMMTDNWPPDHRALTTLRSYLTRMVARIGDRRLGLIEFDQQRAEDGIGSDWHPSVTTHRKMAGKLVERLKQDLRW